MSSTPASTADVARLHHRSNLQMHPVPTFSMTDLPGPTPPDVNAHAQVQDFMLLQRVAQRTNSTLDLDALLEQIVDDVKETFGYSRTGVLFLDEATNELEIVAVRGWTVNFHVKGDRFPVGWGMIGHVAETRQTYYAADVRQDPHYMVSEETTRSEVDIPIMARGRLIGVLSAQHAERDAFPPHRIQLLEALAGHLGVAIENARAFERERLERERMAQDLVEARAIQLRLFPAEAPDVRGFHLSGHSMPCLSVGGDWYDYIPLQNGRLAVVLADVSGKGPGAALVMTSTRSIVRMHAERGLSPGAVLDEVNRVLKSDLPAGKFVTMIYAVLDPLQPSVTYSNAGHPPPIFVSPDECRLLRTTPQLPLGIARDPYRDHTLKMTAGDRLLFYSDGLIEARNPSKEEYGVERLLSSASARDTSVDELLRDVERHAEGRPAGDDVTIVLITAVPA